VQQKPDHGFKLEVNRRAIQLDGMRAIAMMAICWDHWRPTEWSRGFPFEIFLFLFLVLTGYLITGSLLRERDRSEARGGTWKLEALKTYQIRRGLRIFAPYYAALGIAWVVRAPDALGPQFAWYFVHLSNIHMALVGHWPAGTNHFWSLASQQQFYLVWPFVIWFLPRKALLPALLGFTALAPLSRLNHDFLAQWFAWPELLTWSCFDYFGIGGILALAVHRGMSLESPAFRWVSRAALAAYVIIFGAHQLGMETYGWRIVQQSFLSIGLCGVIAIGSTGMGGLAGKLLESAPLQRIGQLSYGIYLFHNLAPLLAGKLVPFLWGEAFMTGPGAFVKPVVFAAVTWGLTLASWRWIETPLQEFRAKLKPR
jgi:peptidoglycan/LPS O-acetylase OafA/YrhL